MVFTFAHENIRCCVIHCVMQRFYRIEPLLKETQQILSLGSNTLKLVEYVWAFQLSLFGPRLQWFVGSRKNKHAAALYFTFCKVSRIKPRLKKAPMILSLGSNRYKLCRIWLCFLAFPIRARIKLQEKTRCCFVPRVLQDLSHWEAAQKNRKWFWASAQLGSAL